MCGDLKLRVMDSSLPQCIPTRRQRYSTSCGWAALAIVADYYGVDVSLLGPEERWAGEPLRMLDIREMAENAGLHVVAGAVSSLGACPVPALVLVDHGRDPYRTGPDRRLPHFLVVFAVTGDRVLFSDPAEGRILEMPRWWFERVWMGVAAVFGQGDLDRG